MRFKALLPLLLAAPGLALAAETVSPPDVPAAVEYVTKANALAGSDLTKPLFLCRPDSIKTVVKALREGTDQWVEPTRLFDNLYFVGNNFVGVFILRTSAGLILFDSSETTEQARDHLVPGIVKLGLNPKDIKYVIVTHAHWDHYGGANYLKATYGARIGLSEPDWVLLEHEAPGSLERGDQTPPVRDLVVKDGQTLTLGDTIVTLYVTPGHTPGPVSAIIPAKEGGKTYPLSLLGSTAFPPNLEPNEHAGGLLAYDASVRRFSDVSRDEGAVGILNTHLFADGTTERLAAARTRTPGQPNPFLIGTDAVVRYYGIIDQCLLAAEARPAKPDTWTKAFTAKTDAD
jgi:metallo-beta-lactamase class B